MIQIEAVRQINKRETERRIDRYRQIHRQTDTASRRDRESRQTKTGK